MLPVVPPASALWSRCVCRSRGRHTIATARGKVDDGRHIYAGAGQLPCLNALRVLQVERVALVGAPWFDPEWNELGTAYFASQDFDVVSSASAELSQDPRAIEPAAVCEWTSRHVEDAAQAVFIGGNGFRAAGAIQALEAAIDAGAVAGMSAGGCRGWGAGEV